METRALVKACGWLAGLTIDSKDSERHVQRLFAICAGQAVHESLVFRRRQAVVRCAGKLPAFDWFDYPGDPFIAAAAHVLLLRSGIHVVSLAELSDGLAGVLRDSASVPQSPLLCDLLAVPECPGTGMALDNISFPCVDSLVSGGRDVVLEACRVLMHRSACGTREVQAADFRQVLPLLCITYARTFDIATVCALLRACAYLCVAETRQCRWAREWLLHQQQPDGRFGLLYPEARRGGWDAEAWETYFIATIEAVWTLAELLKPGFLGANR